MKEFARPGLNLKLPFVSHVNFWLSIVPVNKALFSRRNGYKGKIIFGYSVVLRFLGRDIV